MSHITPATLLLSLYLAKNLFFTYQSCSTLLSLIDPKYLNSVILVSSTTSYYILLPSLIKHNHTLLLRLTLFISQTHICRSPVQLKTSKRSISSLVVCFYLSCILFSTIAQMKKKKTITKKLDSIPISNAVQSSRLIIFLALLFI